MNSKKALEFLTEGVCDCPRCSKYVECMDLDESESVCENAKFIIKKDLNRLEQLEKEYQKLKEINEQLEGCNKEVSEYAYQLAEENSDLKQAFKFLRKELCIYCYEKKNIHKEKEYWLSYKDSEGLWVTYTIPKDKYELLKQAFESVGEE